MKNKLTNYQIYVMLMFFIFLVAYLVLIDNVPSETRITGAITQEAQDTIKVYWTELVIYFGICVFVFLFILYEFSKKSPIQNQIELGHKHLEFDLGKAVHHYKKAHEMYMKTNEHYKEKYYESLLELRKRIVEVSEDLEEEEKALEKARAIAREFRKKENSQKKFDKIVKRVQSKKKTFNHKRKKIAKTKKINKKEKRRIVRRKK